MDEILVQIKYKGRSGKSYSFVHGYNLINEKVAGSEGIYVFAKSNETESGSVLSIQFLQNKEEVDHTVNRMKEDGALFAFFKECSDELACDAEIDDIKSGGDYRKSIG